MSDRSGDQPPQPPHSPSEAEPELLREGTRVGRYTIVQPLGSGAMGVVYSAYDPDLDRKIALKLMRTGSGSTGGANTRARVLREAKANARLSHPNVVPVYDVGSFKEDEVFIAMEHVVGGTLRDAVQKRSAWREKLDLYLQAGEGLAAAHAAGLVHRDFKPDNVLLGPDGRPRVCDFGLARLLHADDATATEAAIEPAAVGSTPPDLSSDQALAATLTRTGAFMGTPGYMAPEQLRSEPADERSDIFAFCVALYEALYGRRPFGGANIFELFENVLAERILEPPATTDVPRWIFVCLTRGLKRNPNDRYPSMHALLADLRSEPRAKRSVWSRATPAVLVAIAIAAGVVVVREMRAKRASPASASAAASASSPPPDPIASLRGASFKRITFESGCEEFPSFTRDGRAVVYDGSEGPDSSLFVLSLDDLSKRRLTRVKGWDFAASVSPDGTRVAFLRSTADQSGAFVVPIDATPETAARFIASGSLRPSWSPDGSAIWAGEHTRFTARAVSDGHVVRSLDVPTGYVGGQSVELPDGRLVVTFPFIKEAVAGAVGVYARDGTLKKLLEGNMGEVLAILPGGASAIVAEKHETIVYTPFAVPLDGSPAVSLAASGIAPVKGLAVSPDGKKIVYSTCRGSRNLLRVARDGRASPVSQAADWEDTDAASIAGGDKLAVVSERSGKAQVWIVDKNGGPPRALATPSLEANALDASRDGKWIAAAMSPNGIWLLAADESSPPRRLTNGATDDEPAFDATGQNVLFTREGADKALTVMIVPVAGGDPKPLLERGSRSASVGPDGRVVYVRAPGDRGDQTVMLFDPKRGQSRPLSRALVPGGYGRPQVSPDGKRVAVLRSEAEVLEIDAATGAIVRTFKHDADLFSRVAYSGDDLVVARALWAGDLWLADVRSGGGE
jgi:serine/threonine protein kinase